MFAAPTGLDWIRAPTSSDRFASRLLSFAEDEEDIDEEEHAREEAEKEELLAYVAKLNLEHGAPPK